MAGQKLLPRRDDGGASGRQLGDQLGLGRGDGLDAPQQLQVDGPHADDHARPRAGRSGPARRSGLLRAWPSPGPAPRSARGALRISSGRPISVFRLAREATVRRCGASSASSRSLVEVFPVDPVTPMTVAPSSSRQAAARLCRAASGSSARQDHRRVRPSLIARPRHAPGRPARPRLPRPEPGPRNCPRPSCDPGSPTNSAPGPASRESIVARSGPGCRSALLASRAPAAWAIFSGPQPLIGSGPRLAAPPGPR